MPPQGDFRALGDAAVRNIAPQAPHNGTILIAPMPGFENALAHPVGFQNMANAAGAGSSTVAYWDMVPPAGYTAMGLCFTDRYTNQPLRQNYWCVRNDYVLGTRQGNGWSDRGARLMDNMNINQAINPPKAAAGEMLLLPPTWLWDDQRARTRGAALRVAKLGLKLSLPFVGEKPDRYAGRPQSNQRLRANLGSVEALPFVAVPYLDNASAQSSPFFFVAIRDYWQCISTDNHPGRHVIKTTVGTEKSRSDTFREKTGITLSGEAGVQAGGFSAKISASYDQEMESTASRTDSEKTEYAQDIEYTVDEGTLVAEWQRIKWMEIFNSAADPTIAASFRTHDVFSQKIKY